ncbi:MAG: hypothetical protein Q8S73_26545 [Deltaproteobacteria bacterium]|nr:hypothetical protein [Myxococcales bacterium]MDP3217695.1 hypothetical protein [Deltaproteobacteria bacterium]
MGQNASQGYVDMDGVTLLKSASLKVAMTSGNADVMTVLGGFEGHTKGTAKYVVSITNPVPAEGFERNWFNITEDGKTHQLRFVILRPEEAGGGILYELSLEGDFRDPSIDIGVNKAVDNEVSFHGRKV